MTFAKRLLRLSWIFLAVGFVVALPLSLIIPEGGPVAVAIQAYSWLCVAGQLAAGIIAGYAYSDLPPDRSRRRSARTVMAISLLVPGMTLFGWLISGQSG